MEYNSQRERIRLPEYGRAIQDLVKQAVEIPDRTERTKAAFALIQMMAITNPALKELKETEDIQHKLWDHLFIISDFKLDVEAPFPMPDPEAIRQKPKTLAYPQNKVRLRHYGMYIEQLIDKAKTMEPSEGKDRFVEVIANLMKKAYLVYNQDNVSDEQIRSDLSNMSGQTLSLRDEVRLRNSAELLAGMNQYSKGGAAGGAKKKKKKKKIMGSGFKPMSQRP
jgi:hypothetical protein